MKIWEIKSDKKAKGQQNIEGTKSPKIKRNTLEKSLM
jgi:hypothetical protein